MNIFGCNYIFRNTYICSVLANLQNVCKGKLNDIGTEITLHLLHLLDVNSTTTQNKLGQLRTHTHNSLQTTLIMGMVLARNLIFRDAKIYIFIRTMQQISTCIVIGLFVVSNPDVLCFFVFVSGKKWQCCIFRSTEGLNSTSVCLCHARHSTAIASPPQHSHLLALTSKQISMASAALCEPCGPSLLLCANAEVP